MHRISKFIGIDMSITSPGLCIFSRNGDEHVTSIQSFSNKGWESHIHRYKQLTDVVLETLGIRRPKNTAIVIEDYAAAARGRTFALAECCGLLKYRLLFHCLVPPENIKLCCTQHLKMYVSGVGNCPKDVVIKEVFKKYGFDTNSNDEADAYVLGKICKDLFSSRSVKGKRSAVLQKIIEYNKKKEPPK